MVTPNPYVFVVKAGLFSGLQDLTLGYFNLLVMVLVQDRDVAVVVVGTWSKTTKPCNIKIYLYIYI